MNPSQDRPKARPKVGIVVLNWNGWRDTIECLESVRKLGYPDFVIILVDNGSTDDSLDRIDAWADGRIPVETDLVVSDRNDKPVPVEILDIAEAGREPFPKGPLSSRSMLIIKTGDNLGYAGGNNVGIKAALELGCPYVWILNNDTVAAPDSLEELVRAAETTSRAGFVGSRLFHYDRPGSLQSAGYDFWIFRSLSRLRRGSDGPTQGVIPVKWLMGSSLLVRAEMIRDVGMLDKDYFLFHEEMDWCLRARRRGWRSYWASSSRVWHKWGGSFPEKKVPRSFLVWKAMRLPWPSFPGVMYYEVRSGVHFVKKHFPILLVRYVALRTGHLVFQVLLFDRNRLRRIRIILRGTRDGLRGRMGRADLGREDAAAGPRTRAGSPGPVTAVVSFYRSFPPESGGASVSFDLARFLPGTRALIQLTERPAPPPLSPDFEIIDVPGLPTSPRLKALWLITKFSVIARTVRRLKPDFVILEGSSWSLYSLILYRRLRRTLPSARIVYHAHNVEYALRAEKDNRVIAAISRWAEGVLMKRTDLALAVSSYDAAEFERLYGIRPEILPNSVDADRFRDVPPPKIAAARARVHGNGNTVLFMGLIGYPANDEAVDFLIRNVFPGVLEAVPSARLVILGGKIREERPWIENPGVVPFEELPAYLAASDVCVAPIFSGSGTRLKILEYLASGKPVVATTKAVEGLDLQDGRDLLIADSPQDFTASVVSLLNDRDAASRVSRQGQETVRASYSWNTVVTGLVTKLSALAKEPDS